MAWQYPKGTTHTCPHCGKPARTYAEPALGCKPLDSGAWLRCFACGWNGARDYAAAINIALLGIAFLKQDRETWMQHGGKIVTLSPAEQQEAVRRVSAAVQPILDKNAPLKEFYTKIRAGVDTVANK